MPSRPPRWPSCGSRPWATGETYTDLLADRSAWEDYDADAVGGPRVRVRPAQPAGSGAPHRGALTGLLRNCALLVHGRCRG